MYANGNNHTVLAPGDGEVIEIGEVRVVIKVANASQLVCDYSAPASFAGPPMHVHPGFDESYLVLEGRLEVLVDGQLTELAPGACAYVSGAVPHTFRTAGGQPARFISICSPGGFEHYFRGLARGDQELIAATSERFGYRAVDSGR